MAGELSWRMSRAAGPGELEVNITDSRWEEDDVSNGFRPAGP